MSVKIPIWPGSSSYTPGNTPFGYFDSEPAFVTDIDMAANWAARRLGYPVVDVELQDVQFWTAYEEAVTEYAYMVNAYNLRDNMLSLQGAPTGSNLTQRLISRNLGRIVSLSKEYGSEAGAGGKVTYYTGSLDVKAGVQNYDLNQWAVDNVSGSSIEIKRIYHYAPPAIVRYFDPFVGTGMGAQQMLEAFGWGNYSPGVSFLLMPVYADILRLQAIEFNDQIRRSNFSFELVNNQLKLFPIPQADTKLYFQYALISERDNPLKENDGLVSDFSNARYDLIPYTFINTVGKRWILRYFLALCKEMLGLVRSKYTNIPLPGNEVTLNGTELLNQAASEKESLLSELSEHLEAVSTQAQLQRRREESENLIEVNKKIPLPFKIG